MEQDGVEQCAKCGAEPRVPGQRWGKVCRASAAKARRDALKNAPEPGTPEASVLARVGINALIDEATGYQEKRSPTALRDMAAAERCGACREKAARIRILEMDLSKLKRELAGRAPRAGKPAVPKGMPLERWAGREGHGPLCTCIGCRAAR